MVIFAGTALRACAEFTASVAKGCNISGFYSRKKPQRVSFNNYFRQLIKFAVSQSISGGE